MRSFNPCVEHSPRTKIPFSIANLRKKAFISTKNDNDFPQPPSDHKNCKHVSNPISLPI